MTTYFFMALVGLIACAIAGMILLDTTQQFTQARFGPSAFCPGARRGALGNGDPSRDSPSS